MHCTKCGADSREGTRFCTKCGATLELEQDMVDDVGKLINGLKDTDWGVRGQAAQELGYIGDARAVEPLIEALKDKESYVRSLAANALGKIGDARAVKPLTKTLRDQTYSVRSAAAEALGKIKGGTPPSVAADGAWGNGSITGIVGGIVTVVIGVAIWRFVPTSSGEWPTALGAGCLIVGAAMIYRGWKQLNR